MEDQRRTEALEAMNRLQAGIERRRQGEAAELEAICDLAVAYRVDEYDLGQYATDFYREPQKYLAEKTTHPGDEGTPDVSEFLPLEISALLRCSEMTAVGRVRAALNLKYRCPAIYEAILNGEVDYWVGEKASEITKDLRPDLAERVTTSWLERQYGMTPAFALKELRKLAVQADPKTAARREAEAREVRGVWFRDIEPGVTTMSGRVDVLQGRIIDERLGQIARRLKDRYPD